MVPGTSSTRVNRPHPVPAARSGSRAGVAVAVTVGGPVGVFAVGFGTALNARVTGWLVLVLLVGAGCYGIVRWVLRSWTGSR